MIAVYCVATLGFLLFGLGLSVSILRGVDRQMFGFTPDPTNRLYKLIRAHGNTAEYVEFCQH